MIKKIFAIVMCLAMFAPMFAGAQTYDINMLLQVIQQLQAQIAALQTGATTAPASSSSCFDVNLEYGMDNNNVKAMQEVIGVTPTSGYFGPITLAAVKGFQAENGVPNTGYVGPMTRAALNNMYCDPTPVVVVPTTMPTFPTTPVVTTPTSTCNGEEGTLVARTTGVALESTVYKYATSKNVFAFELEAKNSDITVSRVDVNMTSASQLPWKVLNSLDLYIGGELVKSMTVNSSNLIENTYGTDYTARFTGLNFTMAKDAIKQIIVKANVGYPESTEVITFKLLANGVRGLDCSGLDQYANSSALGDANNAVTPSASSVSAKLEILSNSQNVEKSVQTNANSATYDVPALYFDVKNSGTEDTTIKTLSVTLTNVTNISAVKLYDGSTLLSSKAASTSISFANLSIDLSANTQKTMTVKYDLAANATGSLTTVTLDTTTTTSVVAISPSGDNVVETGSSVTSKALHAAIIVPEISFVSSSIAITPDTTGAEADATIKFNVTANGGDVYVATTAGKADAAATAIVNLNDTTATDSYSMTTNADLESAGVYVVRSGNTKEFVVNTHIGLTDATTAFTYINLDSFTYSTGSTKTGLGTTYNYGLTDYKTDSVYVK